MAARAGIRPTARSHATVHGIRLESIETGRKGPTDGPIRRRCEGPRVPRVRDPMTPDRALGPELDREARLQRTRRRIGNRP